MKKTASLLLVISVIVSSFSLSAYASTTQSSVLQTVSALGIINGDENGNMNLTSDVTRAQFAKMMIAASSYKDTISTTANASPFKDVSFKHWAASYIKTAVTAGWLTGYIDGTYHPESSVKLEEAATAVLKMLGYTTSDFSGSFPEAQLAKFSALGLGANISKTKGQVLSRQDCMNLFYNLMRTKNKSGSYYAATLGYTVSSAGELDYSSLVLKNMQGPFIVEDSTWSSSLPFSASLAAIYKNGSASTVSAVSKYDVYYYNTGMKTLWVYRNRISGVYTAALPSTSAPTSVTVAGKSYSIASSTAAYALSDMGSYGIGDSVTLLLGMNGDVVGVVSAGDLSETKYGFVTATGTATYTNSTGSSYTANTVTVFCTDGGTYDFEVSSSGYTTGTMVKVVSASGKTTVTAISETSLSGTVNSSGTAIGGYALASDVQILDSSSNGSYLKIYPSRLAGLYLNSSQVRYYALDAEGSISDLILNDVTGDMYQFGILTSADVSTGSISINASYTYIIKGVTSSYSSSSTAFGATTGPVLLEVRGTGILSMRNLTSVPLTALNSAYATGSDSTQYILGDGASVYICKSGSYYLSSVSAVSDTSAYTLYGYYDKAPSSGGRVRVIIAYPTI